VPDSERRSTRGRKLSLDRIVTATLELIDEQGLGAASMRNVGSRLGVRAMSLYKHIATRDELLDAVVERIVSELDADPGVQATAAGPWQDYLVGIAGGVRRYALAHPHAFPLVATRPAEAPWVNPPLRSLRWIESFLAGLSAAGFTDDQVLFAYRRFNGFLLGHLLLETGAMTLRDPKPGDGSFAAGSSPDGSDPIEAADPVPGGLAPTRSSAERDQIAQAQDSELADPLGELDASRYPVVARLGAGLAADTWAEEFDSAMQQMIRGIELHLSEPG
jgi:TetR/AcrR family tetracycline transcriptional repressor